MQTDRLLALTLVTLLLLPSALLLTSPSASAGNGDLAAVLEENWNGQNVIDLAEELCEISADNPTYRVSGSEGADQAADLIASELYSYGLEVREETFDLPVWSLLSEPTMVYDADGNLTSVDDDLVISSFQAESYSFPTPEGGVQAELVTLPVPDLNSMEDAGDHPIDTVYWDTVNVTGKALLIGREVRWGAYWEQVFKLKIMRETPSVIIFCYSSSMMSFSEEFSQSSTGGRPLGAVGPIFWDLEIPVGSVNYSDGRMLAALVDDGLSLNVTVQIPSVIGEGQHRNIIADIPASSGTGEYLVIGAHYDTVLCEGFIDNSAGVATMLEIARMVQMAKGTGDLETRYGLRFIAFAGEELGLAGSINYVYSHQAEIGSMVAVMIIDSIGSRSFKVSDAYSYRGIDLNDLVEDAADQLDTNCTIEAMDSSDHASFMYPEQVSQNYNRYWRALLELRAVQGVPNSLAFYSSPITIYEGVYGPGGGHIHTQSDSRDGLGDWIDLNDLRVQSEVIALTALYSVSVEHVYHDTTWIYVVLIIVAVTAVISYYVLRH